MGASGWNYFAPYQADISAALQRLREDVFADGGYLCGVVVTKSDLEAAHKACGSNLESALEAFAAQASDPRLPVQTQQKFAALVKLYKRSELPASTLHPKPTTIRELLELQGENGTHSILDIDRISPVPTFGAITPMPTWKLLEIFGSEQPTRVQIESKYKKGALAEYVSARWQGIYIIVFRGGLPDEIFFAGCSGD